MARPVNVRLASAPLRIALIGCGRMGIQHLKAIARIPGAAVVAVADPAADATALRAAFGDGIRVFDDAARMLAEAAPQAVHIVTPPESHAALTRLALEAGCHVYVEKPFATRLADADALLALAARRGRLVCAGHQCLFEEPALRAVELLPAIGEVVHVTSLFSFRMVRRTITAVEQCKDILPHAVYPLLQQLRAGAPDAPVEVEGCIAHETGDLYALLRIGRASGIVQVTLRGRPVEQYQDVVGTNGTLRVDYLTAAVTHLAGPGTGPGVLLTPWRRGRQTSRAARRLFLRALTGRAGSYAGLLEILRRFYAAIDAGAASPVAPREIRDTVDVCERLGAALDAAESAAETAAAQRLEAEAAGLPGVTGPVVLVTGGTGFLGRHVAAELRRAGFPTRVIARRLPSPSRRVAGVEYAAGDLACGLDAQALAGVGTIVHCAAETAGGEREHERNSIEASRRLVDAAARAGIRRFVHVSSLAVLEPSYRRNRPVDERMPIGDGARNRGPYVWGKAESERIVAGAAASAGIDLRIVRPGPLVDFEDFQPPGRLGRELGALFVAIGPRRGELPVCDVRTAARVLRWYVAEFASAPAILNLVEGTPPRRIDLVRKFLATRSDLRAWWLPRWLLRLLNGPAILVQRLLGADKPVDLYAAFAGACYRTDLAAAVIERARG